MTLLAAALLGSLLTGCGPSEAELAAERRAEIRANWKGEGPACGPGLSRAEADESLALGRAFLLNNLWDEGNFAYEYDWKSKTDSKDDNEVRQAGATWGIALLLHDDPSDTELRDALLEALAFWEKMAVDLDDGRRLLFYKGGRRGSTGMVSLVALAHIELLRSGAPLPPERRARLEKHLDGLLATIRGQRHPSGGFHSYFRTDGSPFRSPNPYADGEAVLALTKAAKYTGHEELFDIVVPWVKLDRQRNVVQARAKEADSDTTKGYYQWSSMTWYELATSQVADRADFAEWVIELAVWMIDTHRTLRRTRNTSYAYEGIILAYELAREREDPREDKLRCVIDQGMRKLTTWQVGHSLAFRYLRDADPADTRARGGIQNTHDESPLRIDVTQHQMHAVVLHRRYVATEDEG